MKISFKDTELNKSKIITKKGRVTTVTLWGRMKMPIGWDCLPSTIFRWIVSHPTIELTEVWAPNKFVAIKVQGKATRAECDEDNPILAERLAEARAKIKLYNFMKMLIYKWMQYYVKQLYGHFNGYGNYHTVIMPDFKGGLQDEYAKYCKFYKKEIEHLDKLMQEA